MFDASFCLTALQWYPKKTYNQGYKSEDSIVSENTVTMLGSCRLVKFASDDITFNNLGDESK